MFRFFIVISLFLEFVAWQSVRGDDRSLQQRFGFSRRKIVWNSAGLVGSEIFNLEYDQRTKRTWAATSAGLYYLSNGESKWVKVAAIPSDSRDVTVDRLGNIFVSTFHGGVLRSDDQGVHWKSVLRESHHTLHFTAIRALSNDNIIAITAEDRNKDGENDYGEAYVSRDHGQTWEVRVSEPIPFNLITRGVKDEVIIVSNRVALRSKNNGLDFRFFGGAINGTFCSDANGLMYTTGVEVVVASSAGEKWEVLASPPGNSFLRMIEDRGGRVFAVGHHEKDSRDLLFPIIDVTIGQSLGSVGAHGWMAKYARIKSVVTTGPHRLMVGTDNGVFLLTPFRPASVKVVTSGDGTVVLYNLTLGEVRTISGSDEISERENWSIEDRIVALARPNFGSRFKRWKRKDLESVQEVPRYEFRLEKNQRIEVEFSSKNSSLKSDE